MSLTTTPYRDRIYIVEDIILKLVEHGELNQTALVSFCGLNLKKHRYILDELEVNGLINRNQSAVGNRAVAIYKPTQKGIEFCRTILEPYERMFPRRKEFIANNFNDISNDNDERPTTRKASSSSREELGQRQVQERQQEKQDLPLINQNNILVAH
jgi:predicted transcriptional regulator